MPRTRLASRPSGRKEPGVASRHPSAGRRNRGGSDAVADLREGAERSRVASARRSLRRTYSESAAPPAISGAIAGATAAAGSLLVVLVVVVLGWILAGDHSSLGSMLDLTANGWLAVHLLPVEAGGELVWVPPLALTGLLVWGARAVGASTVRRAGAADAGARWRIILSGVVVYAAVATVVAALAATADAGVPILLVPLATGAVFGLGFATGVAKRSGAGEAVQSRVPAYLIAEGRAALRGLAVLVGGSAAVLLLAAFLSADKARAIAERLHPGISGTVLLALIGVLILPTALVWSASFVLGAGFSVGGGFLTGEGTIIAPWAVRSTQMPDFPPLAAVPATHSWWYAVVLVVPLLAAFWAARRAPAPVSAGFLGLLASRGRIAGLAAAVAAAAAALAHVSLGGRLSGLGPAPLAMAGAVLVWFMLGLLLAAAAAAVWERVRSRFARPAAQADAGLPVEAGGGALDSADHDGPEGHGPDGGPAAQPATGLRRFVRLPSVPGLPKLPGLGMVPRLRLPKVPWMPALPGLGRRGAEELGRRGAEEEAPAEFAVEAVATEPLADDASQDSATMVDQAVLGDSAPATGSAAATGDAHHEHEPMTIVDLTVSDPDDDAQPAGKEPELVSLALELEVPMVLAPVPEGEPLGDPGESETVVLDPPAPLAAPAGATSS